MVRQIHANPVAGLNCVGESTRKGPPDDPAENQIDEIPAHEQCLGWSRFMLSTTCTSKETRWSQARPIVHVCVQFASASCSASMTPSQGATTTFRTCQVSGRRRLAPSRMARAASWAIKDHIKPPACLLAASLEALRWRLDPLLCVIADEIGDGFFQGRPERRLGAFPGSTG